MLLPDPSIRRAASALLAGLALSASALAAPQAPSDGVSRLLAERGLLTPFIANPHPGSLQPAASASASAGFVAKVRDSASGMVVSAMNFLGVRYVRGGNSAEEGFDCSGFTRYLFEHSLGLVLPRRADEQAKAPGLLKVKRTELQPGDLVFFNTLRRTFSHVGIYVGGDKFIHAPRSGANVRVEDMSVAYWAKRFTGARRPAEVPAAERSAVSASQSVPAVVGAAPATALPAVASPLPHDTSFN